MIRYTKEELLTRRESAMRFLGVDEHCLALLKQSRSPLSLKAYQRLREIDTIDAFLTLSRR